MRRNDLDDKFDKTAKLLGGFNIMMSPLLLWDTQVGLLAALVLNAFVLSQLHSLGKQRRAGSNVINDMNSFFAARFNTESHDFENAVRNIINGGAAVFDELIKITEGQNYRP